MVIESYNKASTIQEEVKSKVKLLEKCPVCGRILSAGIEASELIQQDRFPYPHIVLHGDPLHAMILYIDRDLQVRGIEAVRSIEIERHAATLQRLIRKWSNPF